MKKSFFIFISVVFCSCVQEHSFKFNEVSIEKKEPTNITVIYPQLVKGSEVSSKIDEVIKSTIASQIAFFKEETDALTLESAISEFENRFTTFKTEFEAEAIPWEVNINGEVVFQSSEVITVGIDSYTFTGGAHGNSVITLLNFDPKTGQLYNQNDLLKTFGDLTELVKRYFKKEMDAKKNSNASDYFFGDNFKLPENIGFDEEGVIFLYNNYELSSFADGITEFTIPYSEVSKFLKINH